MTVGYLLQNRFTGKTLRVITTLDGKSYLVAKDIDEMFFNEQGHSRTLKALKPGAARKKFSLPKKLAANERTRKLTAITTEDLLGVTGKLRDASTAQAIQDFCLVFNVFMIGITHEAKVRSRKHKGKWYADCSVCGTMKPMNTHQGIVQASDAHVKKFHQFKLVATAVI